MRAANRGRTRCLCAVLILNLVVIGCSAQNSEPKPVASPSETQPLVDTSLADAKDAVEEAFEEYRSALLERDGEAAAALISSSTERYYDKARRLALSGTRQEIFRESLIDRLLIGALRIMVPKSRLERMDGRSVVTFAVERGLIDARSTARLEVGQVIVHPGGTAQANMAANRRALGFAFEFNLEDGRWKIDLTSLLPLANLVLKRTARESGADEDAVLLELLESVSGKRVTDALWDQY